MSDQPDSPTRTTITFDSTEEFVDAAEQLREQLHRGRIVDVLEELSDGELVALAGQELRRVVAGVYAQRKKGSLAIAITVEPVEDTDLIAVSATVTPKVPTAPGSAVYASDARGRLIGRQLSIGD